MPGTAQISPADLVANLNDFIAYRKSYLKGLEKKEAAIFLERLFQAFGHTGIAEAGAVLEHTVKRTGKSAGFADLVWRPRVLIEMKKSGSALGQHYQQAFSYWTHLVPDRPRYVVLCNFDEFWIYDFEKQVDDPVDRIKIEDIGKSWEAFAFLLPIQEEPQFGNDSVAVTKQTAANVAKIFNMLTERGIERGVSRRFILQSVMAMFAEDIRLLPKHTFTQAVSDSVDGASAYDLLFAQFREMNEPGETSGGRFAGTPYFNGGLYANIQPFDLEQSEKEALFTACRTDWSQVRPEIFGTLFEQSLGKSERHAFGAHYTSPADIARIIEPTIVRPWTERIDASWNSIPDLERTLTDLSRLQVLDPACGCGNFLYMAFREMRRLERRIASRIEERRRGAAGSGAYGLSLVSASQFHGIDVNPFACEIAKVTLMIAKKLSADELDDTANVLPLEHLDSNIVPGDALFSEWPKFNVCIGNPPYLGRRRIMEERGASYSADLGARFPNVSGVSDYVSYWFRLAHDKMPEDGFAGLVGTNSIREGHSRAASLDYIVDHGGEIFDAVPSLKWDGQAQVHVSIVNWTKRPVEGTRTLWLQEAQLKKDVTQIYSDLTADIDLRSARALQANKKPKLCYQGQTPGHVEGFVLNASQVFELKQKSPDAPIFSFATGDDLNDSGEPERWIIDIDAVDAAMAKSAGGAAFDRVQQYVLPSRSARAEKEMNDNTEALRKNPRARVNWHHRNFLARWWQLSYRRRDLLQKLEGAPRYIGLARYAIADRPSVYLFLDPQIRPSDKVVAFTFQDDYSFGILSSSLHRAWFERRCTTLGQAVSYTNTTVFDTFPWPQSPSESQVRRITKVVSDIHAYRRQASSANIAVGAQYDALRLPGKNKLRDLHAELDAAVRSAYGFDHPEEDLMSLLALNRSLGELEDAGEPVRRPGPIQGVECISTKDVVRPVDFANKT